MDIRQEQPTDYDAVYQVVKEAFADAEHTDGDEQNLVVRLRKSKSFIPELSLVAVEDESFMAICLNGTVGKLSGVMEYDEAFGL